MKTDLLLLTLLYAIALAAFVGAMNVRGRTRKLISLLLAILCLCGAVFNTARHFARSFSEPAATVVFDPGMDSPSSAVNGDSSGQSDIASTGDSGIRLSDDSSVSAAPHPENTVPLPATSPPPVVEAPIKPGKDPMAAKPESDTAFKKPAGDSGIKKSENNPVAPKPAKSTKDSVPAKAPDAMAAKKAENIPTPPKPTKPVRPVPAKPEKSQTSEPVRQAIAPAKPDIESVAVKSDNPAFLEASKIRLKSELETSKRLVMSFSSLNLGYSSQISDAEYDALAGKTKTLLNDIRKTKGRLNALNDRLPSELGKAWGILATGEAFLISAGVNAERFFKAEKEDEEKRRLEAFHQDIESASIALRDAGEALDTVKTGK